jgi:hypothetical protein
MWRNYFGPRAHLYGVDIEEACRAYDGHAGAKVFIGDQADRKIDVVIDDGSHLPPQQAISVEELLPHLRRGGVYLCEDIHGGFNRFSFYVHGLAHKLNESGTNSKCTPFQSEISSVHIYPFVVAIEKNASPLQQLMLERRGTEWQKFWWEKSA